MQTQIILLIENNRRRTMVKAMMMIVQRQKKTFDCYGCNMIMNIDVLNQSMTHIQNEPTRF